MASRFTYGATSRTSPDGTLVTVPDEIAAADGPESWFEIQLNPLTITDTRADELDTWWESLHRTPADIAERDKTGLESAGTVISNYQRWSVARRIYSQRHVHELMSEFWENHLHVSTGADNIHPWRADYGLTIRAHALGKYSDLLPAAITHPAMATYLNNATSTKQSPNEDLGRELLELHTVGLGHYTQDDVVNSARILTGWKIDKTAWVLTYDPARHWVGPITVMDFTHANSAADGRDALQAYLSYLAHHPATAERIAHKLAVRFVSDNPSAALVKRLAKTYLDSDTDIKPVLRELVRSAEFNDPAAPGLVRTPTDDVVATHRALGINMARPAGVQSAATLFISAAATLGQLPFAWPRPDGQPSDNASWSSASRLLGSFSHHWSMAAGVALGANVTYRPAASWMPKETAVFDELVIHAGRLLLGQNPRPEMLTACREALGVPGELPLSVSGDIISTPTGSPFNAQVPLLLATLLDSPDHMHR